MAKFEYMERAFSSGLKPRARLVLQVLVLHCNKEGECFPSIKTIAAKCGYGVSTVKRALDELVKAGYIVKQARFDERKNGGQTSNLYTLCSDLPCPDEPENVPVPEDDAFDEPPAVQPESAPADACEAPDPTPPDLYVDWGAVHFYTPLNRTGEQILTDEEKSNGWPQIAKNKTDRGRNPCRQSSDCSRLIKPISIIRSSSLSFLIPFIAFRISWGLTASVSKNCNGVISK